MLLAARFKWVTDVAIWAHCFYLRLAWADRVASPHRALWNVPHDRSTLVEDIRLRRGMRSQGCSCVLMLVADGVRPTSPCGLLHVPSRRVLRRRLCMEPAEPPNSGMNVRSRLCGIFLPLSSRRKAILSEELQRDALMIRRCKLNKRAFFVKALLSRMWYWIPKRHRHK